MRAASSLNHVVPGQHIAPRISGDVARQPIGLRVGSDENKETAALHAMRFLVDAVSNVDCGQVRVTVSCCDL